MKHARADYDRIQDPAGLIPKDEPVMLFRAQDKHFDRVLRFYRDIVIADNGDPKIVEAVDRHLALADAWPVRKRPDMPDEIASRKPIDVGQIWRHKERGSSYMILSYEARIQCSCVEKSMQNMLEAEFWVSYRDIRGGDHPICFRMVDEFLDGRFERVS